MSREQLVRAASEFHKRWKQSEECDEKGHSEPHASPIVLVSQDCSDIPGDDLTASVLKYLDGVVDKLWYLVVWAYTPAQQEMVNYYE